MSKCSRISECTCICNCVFVAKQMAKFDTMKVTSCPLQGPNV